MEEHCKRGSSKIDDKDHLIKINQLLEFEGDFSKQFNEMLGKHVDEEHYNNRMEKMLLQSQELQKKNQRLFDIASSKNIISNSNVQRPKALKKDKRSSSVFSEIALNRTQIAMKISIRDEKVKQFEKLNRGELNSQISKILGDAKTPTEKHDESIRLDVESNSDEDRSVYEVYWEDYKKNQMEVQK